jgi:hypothetical protein
MTCTCGHRLGYRGRCLLFFALLDLVYGLSLVNPSPGARQTPLLVWMAGIAPLWFWAAWWIVTGLVLLWYAFQHRDAAGFAAAIFLKIFWSLTCVAGWMLAGVERGYVACAIWLAAAALVWNLSGWPEPPAGEGRPLWRRRSSSR